MIQGNKTATKKASKTTKKKLVKKQEILQKGKVQKKPKKTAPKKTTKKALSKKKSSKNKPDLSFKNAIKGNLEYVSKMKDFEDMKVEKIAFAIFLSFPKKERGIMADFTKEWGISEVSLWRWKKDLRVHKIKMMFMATNLSEGTEDALAALRHNLTTRNLVNGLYDVPSVKLWLQFVENWKEAQQLEVEESGNINVIFNTAPSHFIQPKDKK